MNKRRIALSDKPRPYELDRLSKALTHSLTGWIKKQSVENRCKKPKLRLKKRLEKEIKMEVEDGMKLKPKTETDIPG